MQKSEFYKNVFRLAFPVAAQNMLATCANMIDTAMVSGLGNAEISAVGVSGKWMFLMNVVIYGLCAGISAQISQFYGAGEKDNMKRAQCTGLFFCTGIALVYMLCALLFPEQLISLFNDEKAVVEAGVDYIRIAAIGAIPSALASVYSVARRAVEDVKVPMYIAGIAVFINTGLNYVLIFGKFGMPELGVKGAAIATTVSLIFQAVAHTVLGLVRNHFSVTALKEVKSVDKDFVKTFTKVSMPSAANEAIWCTGMLICAAIFARQGSENYAAYTIFDSISNLTFIFFQGLGAASAVMIGKSVGAGRLNEAYDMAKRFMMLTPVIGVASGLALILLRNPILMLFDVETQAAREIVSALICFYGVWLSMRMVTYTGVCGIFRAGGDSKFGVFLDLFGLYCFAIPAVLIAAYVIKVPFVILVATMMVVEDGVKVPITIRHLKSRKWIIKLTQTECVDEVSDV